MDKVLAFSILSASPADIASGAGAGFSSSWARLSWRGRPDDQAARARQQQQQPRDKEGGSRSRGGGKPQPKEAVHPRFAPEFDGIDCFETIVAH